MLAFVLAQGGQGTASNNEMIGDERLQQEVRGRCKEPQEASSLASEPNSTFLTMLAELYRLASDTFCFAGQGIWQWREDEAAYTTILIS